MIRQDDQGEKRTGGVAGMKIVEFGTLFQFIRNGMSVKQDKSGDGLPVTRIETISHATVDGSRVGYAGLKEADCRGWFLESGDILFSHINSVEHIGKCAVYRGEPEKLVHGMNLLCLRCDKTKLIPEFAKYLIRGSEFRTRLANFTNKAVNQASVSIGNMKTIPVSVPPLAEQKRIAAILDAADALRTKRRESLAQLDALLQSTFLTLFGDPVANPMGWEVVPFANVGETRLGKMLDKGKQSGEHLRPYLANTNVKWGRFELSDLREMDFNPADRIEFSLRRGDLLICEGGEVGRCAVWKEELQDCYFQKAIHRCRVYADKAVPDFLQFFMWFMAFRGGFKDFVSTSTIAHLTGEKLRKLPVPLPPLPLQQKFAAIVESVERQKAAQRAHLAELDALFAALQHRAFRGEL